MRVKDVRPWVRAGVIRRGGLIADWLPGAWLGDALCAQTDPEAFYPEAGQDGKAAKRICARCPVNAECLSYAVVVDERHGVWGGMARKQRDALTALAVPGMPEVVVTLEPRVEANKTGLSAADTEVARMTAAGMSAREISEATGKTSRSINRARQRIAETQGAQVVEQPAAQAA